MSRVEFNELLKLVMEGKNLSTKQAHKLMLQLMSGKSSDAQIGAFLAALKLKGETVDEIVGLAQGMREKAEKINSKHKVIIDTCGTGGDGSQTFNISTTVAFVLAGAGLIVAKHGNRSVSSRSGSADVLGQLGVNLDIENRMINQLLDNLGIAFLFAPNIHVAMKHVMKARKELGVPTIFNLLGPLTNPVDLYGQVVGVYNPDLVMPIAKVLQKLGRKRAIVVHGAGGLDEASLQGHSIAAFVNEDQITKLTIEPDALGLKTAPLSSLIGGSPNVNAEITLSVLKGKSGPCRDIVLLNSALGFMVGGEVDDVATGIERARESIDSGKALKKLRQLVIATNSPVENGRSNEVI